MHIGRGLAAHFVGENSSFIVVNNYERQRNGWREFEYLVTAEATQNQYSFIDFKNSTLMGTPESEPMTLSIPQRGQSAVCPTLVSSVSHQSWISAGAKILQQ
jgi:hypothetical protein